MALLLLPSCTKRPEVIITKAQPQPVEIFSSQEPSPSPHSIAQGGLKIIEKPVVWNALREKLSQEYIQTHYGVQPPASVTIEPKIIVVHATEIPTLSASFNALNPAVLPNARKELRSAGTLNVSAHFLIDRDGTIYQLLPERTLARHVIGLNLNAIGIENVGGTHETPLTLAQLEANAKLVRFLVSRHPIRWLIGHAEYGNFRGSALWRELDPDYFTFKSDPDPAFMKTLRMRVKDLALHQAPEE